MHHSCSVVNELIEFHGFVYRADEFVYVQKQESWKGRQKGIPDEEWKNVSGKVDFLL